MLVLISPTKVTNLLWIHLKNCLSETTSPKKYTNLCWATFSHIKRVPHQCKVHMYLHRTLHHKGRLTCPFKHKTMLLLLTGTQAWESIEFFFLNQNLIWPWSIFAKTFKSFLSVFARISIFERGNNSITHCLYTERIFAFAQPAFKFWQFLHGRPNAYWVQSFHWLRGQWRNLL
jgi:hypothetical protein